jgi:hypothetical protein
MVPARKDIRTTCIRVLSTSDAEYASMILYEIPYATDPHGGFPVIASDNGTSYFASRVEALGRALALAHERQRQGFAVTINLEGADGRWRSFDPSASSALM